MAQPFYLSRRRVTSGEWTFSATISADNQAMTLSAGLFYNDSPTSTEALVVALDNAFETAYPAQNFTISFSITTGLFSFTCTTLVGTWSVTFNQAAFANWLGFTSGTPGWALSAGPTQTSAQVAQGCIFCGSGRQGYTGVMRRTSGASVVSEAGVTARIGSGSVRRSGAWTHGFEPYAAVSSPLASGIEDLTDIVDPWTWKDFWEHHSRYGEPFRFYRDRTSLTTDLDDTYVLHGKVYDEWIPQRVEDGANTYWRVPMEVHRYGVAT